ncbi:hypothetical protein CDL15_Pgr028687 [Punica granatum]|uniref:Uncharacterized protein n=1 Tax=Punica granatum TaxID=22663 RepID=A0A218VXG8_PUNGR|nr:hypothetical protein CDL15_Pgr028687 [Punica granatum]PKI49554.1 hypothetical protein CRG98_030047 [Punica granatum]
MLETTSSFRSTSSSPSIANLPSIRVRAEEVGNMKLGVEDRFANMVVGGYIGLKQDEGFIVLSSPLPQLLSRGFRSGGAAERPIDLINWMVPNNSTQRYFYTMMRFGYIDLVF